MASGCYSAGLSALLHGQIDLTADQLAALLVDDSVYTVQLGTDSDIGDIDEDAIIADQQLIGGTLDGLIFRADQIVFPAVSGNRVGAVVIYLVDANVAGCTLIAYIDNCAEFPITPDGTDITIHWDVGGIFEAANGV
jgi:hypothetical protein